MTNQPGYQSQLVLQRRPLEVSLRQRAWSNYTVHRLSQFEYQHGLNMGD